MGGIINENRINEIKDAPLEIKAVRGPKTREELIKLGIKCPEVFGDPVLLLPLLYKPKVEKKFKLGIVPHMSEENCDYLKNISSNDVVIISPTKYNSWNSFVDLINSCTYIASSSLHGLIVSEAYHIPNIWISLQKKEDGFDFKYNDFYESIGKKDKKAFVVDTNCKINSIIEEAKKWKKGKIDLANLIDSCPFTIDKENLLKKLQEYNSVND